MIAFVAACAACGPSRLEGSLGALLDLQYNSVTASQAADAVAVKYLKTQGSSQDVVLQVTARLAGTTLTPNSPLDLAEEVAPGVQRGTVSRNAFNDPRTTFPGIKRGKLRFSSALTAGQKVSGDFSVTFVDCTDPACGRTVFGNFGAAVQ